MESLLGAIAILLMVLTPVSFFCNAAKSGESIPISTRQKTFLIVLSIAGLIIGFGGFWFTWMLYLGLIFIDLAGLIYFMGPKRL